MSGRAESVIFGLVSFCVCPSATCSVPEQQPALQYPAQEIAHQLGDLIAFVFQGEVPGIESVELGRWQVIPDPRHNLLGKDLVVGAGCDQRGRPAIPEESLHCRERGDVILNFQPVPEDVWHPHRLTRVSLTSDTVTGLSTGLQDDVLLIPVS